MALYGLMRDSAIIGIAKRVARTPKGGLTESYLVADPAVEAYWRQKSILGWFIQGWHEGAER